MRTSDPARARSPHLAPTLLALLALGLAPLVPFATRGPTIGVAAAQQGDPGASGAGPAPSLVGSQTGPNGSSSDGAPNGGVPSGGAPSGGAPSGGGNGAGEPPPEGGAPGGGPGGAPMGVQGGAAASPADDLTWSVGSWALVLLVGVGGLLLTQRVRRWSDREVQPALRALAGAAARVEAQEEPLPLRLWVPAAPPPLALGRAWPPGRLHLVAAERGGLAIEWVADWLQAPHSAAALVARSWAPVQIEAALRARGAALPVPGRLLGATDVPGFGKGAGALLTEVSLRGSPVALVVDVEGVEDVLDPVALLRSLAQRFAPALEAEGAVLVAFLPARAKGALLELGPTPGVGLRLVEEEGQLRGVTDPV